MEALIGRGGMGQVFRVHDLMEKRDLALKVLHPAEEEGKNRVERLGQAWRAYTPASGRPATPWASSSEPPPQRSSGLREIHRCSRPLSDSSWAEAGSAESCS